MQKVNRPAASWHIIFFVIAILVIVADQLSKVWIRSNLAPNESLCEIGFFSIVNIRNTGAAFGLFRGFTFVLTIISFVGAIFILVYNFYFYRRYPLLNNRLSRIALGLILGGTVGNLIDRLRFGYVTDFIDFQYWPAFNVADSSVTIGVIIFICSLLFLTRIDSEG